MSRRDCVAATASRPPLFEHGVIRNVKVSWAKAGPFLAEWHAGWRCKFGVACGPWYVGVLLGPLVLPFGKRRFLPSSAERWEIAWKLLDVQPPNLEGLDRG